jgi:hypothetical protein
MASVPRANEGPTAAPGETAIRGSAGGWDVVRPSHTSAVHRRVLRRTVQPVIVRFPRYRYTCGHVSRHRWEACPFCWIRRPAPVREAGPIRDPWVRVFLARTGTGVPAREGRGDHGGGDDKGAA